MGKIKPEPEDDLRGHFNQHGEGNRAKAFEFNRQMNVKTEPEGDDDREAIQSETGNAFIAMNQVKAEPEEEQKEIAVKVKGEMKEEQEREVATFGRLKKKLTPLTSSCSFDEDSSSNSDEDEDSSVSDSSEWQKTEVVHGRTINHSGSDGDSGLRPGHAGTKQSSPGVGWEVDRRQLLNFKADESGLPPGWYYVCKPKYMYAHLPSKTSVTASSSSEFTKKDMDIRVKCYLTDQGSIRKRHMEVIPAESNFVKKRIQLDSESRWSYQRPGNAGRKVQLKQGLWNGLPQQPEVSQGAPISCVSCCMTFGSVSDAVEHESLQHPELKAQSSFPCVVCQEAMFSKEQYVRHAQVHKREWDDGKNLYLCHRCNFRSNWKMKMDEHMIWNHGGYPGWVACMKCGHKYPTWEGARACFYRHQVHPQKSTENF